MKAVPPTVITRAELEAFRTELLALCAKHGMDLLSDGGHGALEAWKLRKGERSTSVEGLKAYRTAEQLALDGAEQQALAQQSELEP